MIEQTAKVISFESKKNIDNYYVWVEPNNKSACQSCSSQSTCGTSLIAKIFNHKHKKIRVKNTCSANIGENVVIGMNEKAMLLGSIMIYVLPLFILIAFAGLSVFYSSLANLDKGTEDLLTLFSILISFVISYKFLSHSQKFSQLSFFNVKLIRIV